MKRFFGEFVWVAPLSLALLAGGCGDEEKGDADAGGEGGVVITVDGGADEDSGSDDEKDSGSDDEKDAASDDEKDSGSDETDAGDETDAAVDTDAGDDTDAGVDEPLPGTLLNLPYDGEQGSICYAPDECNGDDLVCFGAVSTAPGQCIEDCAEDSDCSPVDGLDAVCTNGHCLVNCAGDEDMGDGACPTNMECRDLPTVGLPGVITPTVVDLLNPNYWCVYPVDAGTNQEAEMAKCELGHGDGDCKGERTCHMPGTGASMSSGPGYCTDACEADDECSVPGGVNAIAVCGNGACELDCSGAGATCPAGMNCRDVNDSFIVTTYRCRYIEESP